VLLANESIAELSNYRMGEWGNDDSLLGTLGIRVEESGNLNTINVSRPLQRKNLEAEWPKLAIKKIGLTQMSDEAISESGFFPLIND
jgi:hypothetical protein